MGITLGGGSNWLIIRSARFPSKPKKATKSAGSSSLGPESFAKPGKGERPPKEMLKSNRFAEAGDG